MMIRSLRVSKAQVGSDFPFDRVYLVEAADRAQIENTFRAYQATIERANDYGPVNNWNVSEVCGAFYCSLAMQDLADHLGFFLLGGRSFR